MDFNKYKNLMEYPSKLKRPFVSNHPTVEQAKEYIAAMELYEKGEAAVSEARRLYDLEDQRLYRLFKADVLEETGLTDHPKAERAFELAWENHGSGYADVYNSLVEYAELML
jgi:hypothetical protein